MADLFADRFLQSGASWLDVATGTSVRIRVLPAASGCDAMVWNDRCAALSRMRHPLLNHLVDYGHADASHTFEAYSIGTPVVTLAAGAPQILEHAVRFLESHGLSLKPQAASLALREVCAGRNGARGRPLGVVLQRRRALTALEDMLADTAPGGVAALDVSGDPGAGLRTLRELTARAARVQGYTPVCGRVIRSLPWLTSTLADRHVCVIIDTHEDRWAAAALVGSLGLASARRHVLISFSRRAALSRPSVVLEPMALTALVATVFIDPEHGPPEAEVMAAARTSDGFPGRFLEHLNATPYAEHRITSAVVHESAPAYVVRPAVGRTGEARRVLRRSILSAEPRALGLAARGRHASAIRLLTRATRVLERRGDRPEAARCARQLGWILRDRGRSDAALEAFARARSLAPDDPQGLHSAIAIAVVWTDDCRFVEAEAALRSALAASELQGGTGTAHHARVALGRCLIWQERWDEARLVVTPSAHERHALQARALGLMARIGVATGAFREAMCAASRALEIADPADLPAYLAATRAMAHAQAALGDRQGLRASVQSGLAAAASAHLPLQALRLRATLLGSTSGDASSGDRRLMYQIQSALRRRSLPRLLRGQLEAAMRQHQQGPPADRHGLTVGAIEDLQQLLELTFSAVDDRAAVESVCKTLSGRLRAATVVIMAARGDRRMLARAGRPWPGDLVIVDRAMAACAPCRATEPGVPVEVAHPIRYGGEIVAVIACRWTAAATPDASAAIALLHAGALAVASSVRAILDRPVVGAEPACRELIGTGAPMSWLRESLARAARAPFPVLIEGESGSGKELVARAIHRLSARRERRLCAVNCAALSEELIEAELFGHARGAFTGAVGERAGLFEEADGGTLFLDEVAELSQRAQAKLLRVLQDGEVRRVGENFARRVDARVIAATNRSLELEVEAGRFRADLRFRLDVVKIVVPPLRDRAMDIPALAAHFWDEAARRVESRAALAPDTIAALTRYEWPGNVRQLQNVIASLAVHAPRRGRVPPSLLPAHIARCAAPSATKFEAAREEFERRFITAALARAGGHRAKTARALGVTRQGLAKMLRRLGIQ